MNVKLFHYKIILFYIYKVICLNFKGIIFLFIIIVSLLFTNILKSGCYIFYCFNLLVKYPVFMPLYCIIAHNYQICYKCVSRLNITNLLCSSL